jgi:hypothetical protein
LKYITPISVVPLIALVGLDLFDVAAETAAKNWGLGLLYVSRPEIMALESLYTAIYTAYRYRYMKAS